MVRALIVLCIWAQADQNARPSRLRARKVWEGDIKWHLLFIPKLSWYFLPLHHTYKWESLLGFILLFCFHLKVLFWPCQLQLLSLLNIEYFLFLNGPFFYSIEYSPLTWDCRRPFGPRMEDWPLLMLIAFFALSRCSVAHPLGQNISHVSQHSSY